MRISTMLVSAWLALAPYQCGHPASRDEHEETPAEALYEVAGRLRAKGDEAGWRTTLEYIVVRFPASRFAQAAQLDLTGREPPARDDTPPAARAKKDAPPPGSHDCDR